MNAPVNVRALGELTTLISSGSTPKGGSETYLSHGPVMLIRSQNVRMNRLSVEDVAYITEEIDASMKRTRLQQGDVLLNITGASIGRVAPFHGEGKANVNQHVCVIRPNPNALDQRYLAHLIATPEFQGEVDRLQHGGTRQALTFSQIASFSIPLCSLPEQRRIAEVLDRAEALRTKRRAALAQLDTLTQSIFLDLFGDPARNEKRWPLKSLESVGEWQSGGTPPRDKSDYFTGDIPWFSSGELNDMYVYESEEKISEDALANSSAKLVPKGALMLGMYDTAALKSAIAGIECACNQAIAFGKLDARLVESVFVYFCITIGREYFRRLQRGVRQKNMNLSMIRELQIPLPPLSLQQIFCNRITAVEKLKTAQHASLAELDALFASLQHRAFRGEL